MYRQAPGRDQHHVKAAVEAGEFRVPGLQQGGGAGNAGLLARADGLKRCRAFPDFLLQRGVDFIDLRDLLVEELKAKTAMHAENV